MDEGYAPPWSAKGLVHHSSTIEHKSRYHQFRIMSISQVAPVSFTLTVAVPLEPAQSQPVRALPLSQKRRVLTDYPDGMGSPWLACPAPPPTKLIRGYKLMYRCCWLNAQTRQALSTKDLELNLLNTNSGIWLVLMWLYQDYPCSLWLYEETPTATKHGPAFGRSSVHDCQKQCF